jgi:ubiquinone/menaquinone biosynthesis C-methylase UbiE
MSPNDKGALKLDQVQQTARDQFARQSQRYGMSHILADVADVEAALRHIPLPARARVLDVATGAGHTGLHLASLGHDVTLSDLTAPMLQRVAEAAAGRGLTVQLREHPAEALPYADESFDLVTCRVAPHHFSAPAKFFSEVTRVLVAGGWFLLIDGTVADDEPEAEAWLHEVEKLRDPSHQRFLTPRAWKELCAGAGLTVRWSDIHVKKQPDLNWYFETAGTSEENRRRVLKLIEDAPSSARRVFKLASEAGKIAWQWPVLTLIAQKGPV